eukprot:2313909-Rhodomonas_salina.3
MKKVNSITAAWHIFDPKRKNSISIPDFAAGMTPPPNVAPHICYGMPGTGVDYVPPDVRHRAAGLRSAFAEHGTRHPAPRKRGTARYLPTRVCCAMSGICLRACYAMSAIYLRACYAMSGTDVGRLLYQLGCLCHEQWNCPNPGSAPYQPTRSAPDAR